MINIDEIVYECFLNMKDSSDFSDPKTVWSIEGLLESIIDNPQIVTRSLDEEKFSCVMSSILYSSVAQCEFYKGIKLRNMIFACSFYLFMHQLDKGTFYDRNYPAFINLVHHCRDEFAKFIVETNPFAPELISKITGKTTDPLRPIKAVKGIELQLMKAAKRKGFFYEELSEWYNELNEEADELLKLDYFSKEAIPLYEIITHGLKINDLTFVNKI